MIKDEHTVYCLKHVSRKIFGRQIKILQVITSRNRTAQNIFFWTLGLATWWLGQTDEEGNSVRSVHGDWIDKHLQLHRNNSQHKNTLSAIPCILRLCIHTRNVSERLRIDPFKMWC